MVIRIIKWYKFKKMNKFKNKKVNSSQINNHKNKNSLIKSRKVLNNKKNPT